MKSGWKEDKRTHHYRLCDDSYQGQADDLRCCTSDWLLHRHHIPRLSDDQQQPTTNRNCCFYKRVEESHELTYLCLDASPIMNSERSLRRKNALQMLFISWQNVVLPPELVDFSLAHAKQGRTHTYKRACARTQKVNLWVMKRERTSAHARTHRQKVCVWWKGNKLIIIVLSRLKAASCPRLQLVGPQLQLVCPQLQIVGPHLQTVGPHRQTVGPQLQTVGPR